MKNIFKIAVGLLCALAPLSAMAQAKKPTLMVIPAEAWCFDNGFYNEHAAQGRTTRVPDYARACQESMDLVNISTKIGELMAERGFPMKDMAASIRDVELNNIADEMTQSASSGASLAETPLERVLNRAKADIVVEVLWSVSSVGPKKSVTYTLRGLDAYTNKQVAAAQGTGPQSFTAEVPILLEEAVLEHMDQFISQLQ
ncbi:MAG: hypothetical protein K2O12_02590, partial [Muribaculaceae bacterium]|nr:hypothetical protein [Muribaculaceae bacterium]